MYLVAIGEIQGAIEEAIRPLAGDLGTTAYELKLAMNAGFPAVVLVTVDEALARAAAASIARHGHAAIFCDRRDIVTNEQMTQLRDFRFTSDGLLPHASSDKRVLYDNIAVLLRATHRTSSQTSEQVKERKLRPVMAIATGGLVLSKTTTRTVTSSTAHSEQVLYIFDRGATKPLILKERSAQYGGLGEYLSATSFENFGTTIQKLRERCPGVVYDERLKASRPLRGVADGIEATDIYAHLLATFLLKRAPISAGPERE